MTDLNGPFSRTARLIGAAQLARLQQARVAVLGLGGVGAATAEALARAGIGRLLLVDPDRLQVSNLNRQLIALHSTLGQYKTEAMRARIRDINPDCQVETLNQFYLPENRGHVFATTLDYLVDAIDTLTAKIDLVLEADKRQIPLISSMGCGNKLAPEQLTIADLSQTSNCPVARVMRRELRRRGIEHLTVVYSPETPRPVPPDPDAPPGRHPPASISFVPPVAGYLLASVVVRDLIATERPGHTPAV